MNYEEVLTGMDKLSPDQLIVLLEKIKTELKKQGNQSVVIDTTYKEVTNERIEPRSTISEYGNKPESTIECCVYCGSTSIRKHGYTNGHIQRYKCKDCLKSFSANHGLITAYTHLQEWQWLEIIRGIIECLSIKQIANNIHCSKSTVWSYRMKIYQMLQSIYDNNDTFNNIVEIDEKYERLSFKGKRDKSFFIDTLKRMPRHHRDRAEKIEYLNDDYNRLLRENPSLLKKMILTDESKVNKTGISNEQVCVLSATDRAGNIYIEPVTIGRIRASDIYEKLHGRISQDAIMVTDELSSYGYMSKVDRIEHVVIKSGTYTTGAFNLARINNLHSAIDRFISVPEYRPATKYLDLYLMMFWWLEKQKGTSSNELVTRLFSIVTGHISNEARANLNRITIKSLNERKIPIKTVRF